MTVCPTLISSQVDASPPDAAGLGNAKMAAVNESNNTPGGDSNGDSLSNGVAEEKLMPPNLDTFIPVDRLPDIIDVHVDVDVDPDFSGLSQYLNPWRQFTARHAIKFVRQYPPCTLTDEDDVNGSSDDLLDPGCPKRKLLTGQLDFRRSKALGTGHHSKVVLAPLTIPSTPSVCRAVAVKYSPSPYAEREMLLEEAKVYNAFPRDLQDDDVPVVPKFYGYYVPSTEASDRDDSGDDDGGNDYGVDEEEWKSVRKVIKKITPILLLEACGKQVRTTRLSHNDRVAIHTLLKRLHEANFLQGSMYERNVLVQPGPLTLPCADRSIDKPSFRIIDFGRGLSYGLNCSSLTNIRGCMKEERRMARDHRLVPYRLSCLEDEDEDDSD